MSIIAIGTDIVNINRIEKAIDTHKTNFITRIFTPYEQEQANKIKNPKKRIAYYAKRYAVKEATAKALGTGIGKHAHWQEIETKNTPTGTPYITLTGTTKQTFIQKTNNSPNAKIHLSISDDTYALAFVVIENE